MACDLHRSVDMMSRTKTSALIVTALCSAFASASIYKVDKNLTSTNLAPGGDRTLITGGFAGSSSTITAANFMHWADGRLWNNDAAMPMGGWGWNDGINRDMGSSNHYSGNPDRADVSTAYALEALSKGTLKEVFGGHNLSWIIDGEDNGEWALDLFFAPGLKLFNDGDSKTVEFTIFERGGNSDIGVKGIVSPGVYTSGTVIDRSQTGYAGWMLNTLEIDNDQKVHGVGISMEALGSGSELAGGLVGLRIYAKSAFNGPDIVGVASAAPVPEPASLACLALGLGAIARRRRCK